MLNKNWRQRKEEGVEFGNNDGWFEEERDEKRGEIMP